MAARGSGGLLLCVGLLLAMPALYVILMQADYRRRRLLTFMDPWADPLGDPIDEQVRDVVLSESGS